MSGNRATRFPPVQGNAFWRQKIRTSFRTLDVNKDGKLSWEDFSEIADLMIKAWPNANPAKAQKTQNTMKRVWEGYFKPPTGNPWSTEEEFIKRMLEAANGIYRTELETFVKDFFGMIDTNDDGTISKSEFITFTKIWRLGDNVGYLIFDVIDRDGNGKIDMDEYIDAAYDFYFNENPHSPHKIFWGPLV